MLYFRILDEHRKAGTLPSIGPDGRVPDGPFLDDLKKHGLVDNCPRESVTTALFRPVLSKPYLVCGGPK